MTPDEVAAFIKAFGVPGAGAAFAIWLWVNRQTAGPGKSRLESDVADILNTMKTMQSELHEMRERIVRIETRQEMQK